LTDNEYSKFKWFIFHKFDFFIVDKIEDHNSQALLKESFEWFLIT